MWLVELAPLSDSTLVEQAVASTLEVREQPGRPLLETLKDTLRTKKTLLVVDNCEHLVEAVAKLVDAFLNSCPHLRILATSRERLNTSGEVNRVVPSLTVPSLTALDSPRALTPTTPRELEAYESVRLFVERARQREPAFVLSQANGETVAQICRQLEGIPLAIELATARIGVLSAKQLSKRLEDSLKVLTSGERTAEPRHQSLRATLEWSHELLSEPERVLFRRLSVFAGAWTLEAAEEVYSGEGVERDDVLELLSGLVEKSLVVAEAIGEDGVWRYRMLEPIRQYAREKLEEGDEGEELRYRHAAFFLALAEDAEPRLRTPEDREWLERLEADHDNMRAALFWSLERAEAELGLRLAGTLWPFWEAHGHYSEASRWLEEALEKEGEGSGAAHAKALEGLGWLTYRRGDTDRAQATLEEGLKLSEEARLGGALTASFLHMLGWIAEVQSHHERARELLEESLRLSREAGDKLGIAHALRELGATLASLGDAKRSKELYEEGIVLSRELGYAAMLARALINAGYDLLLEGDYERGAALTEEAAALLRERGYKGGSLEIVLDNLGWAALLQGDHQRARTSYKESLALCKDLGNKMVASESLDGLACISAAEGESERAARLFGAAETLNEAGGYQHTPAEAAWREPYLATAHSRLGEAAWEEALADGRAMGLEEAFEYALSEEEHELPTLVAEPEQQQPLAADEPPTARLTAREQEIALLVGRGLTNRQIAQELSISERTAANHVGRILKKLGLHSRAQIATWATQGRLVP